MTENIITSKNITKTYKSRNSESTAVLKGITLEIQKGEFISIMGPSGVGKSTLLHVLSSLDKVDSGEVTLFTPDVIHYEKISDEKLSEIRNKYIGFVFQFHHLLPEFTLLENVMFPALISGNSQSSAKIMAEKLLDIVEISHRSSHRPAELSGGEQQRAAIARALINKPLIIFADEPTGNLDTKNASQVIKLLDSLRKEFGTTLVIATHSKEISQSATRNIQMIDGLIA